MYNVTEHFSPVTLPPFNLYTVQSYYYSIAGLFISGAAFIVRAIFYCVMTQSHIER